MKNNPWLKGGRGEEEVLPHNPLRLLVSVRVKSVQFLGPP